MNPDNPVNHLPDVAVLYFTDGISLGPAIRARSVGAELPELILGTLNQLHRHGLPTTIGTATAALCYRAVASGNHVSCTAAPNLSNFPQQLAYLFRRDNAIGGIGVVLVNLNEKLITTYGGRGFQTACPSNPFMPATFPIEELLSEPASGFEPAEEPAAPGQKMATPHKKAAKKKGGRKKGARKKAAAETPGEVEIH